MDKLLLPVASAVILLLLGVLGSVLWERSWLQDEIRLQAGQIVTLQGAVEQQNTKIKEWQAKAEVFEAQATIRARAALRDGARQRAALPAGHGPVLMNRWLHETFGGGDGSTP